MTGLLARTAEHIYPRAQKVERAELIAHAPIENRHQAHSGRLQTIRDAIFKPINWHVVSIWCMHADTFDLVSNHHGQCKLFLKASLPMDPKQVGFTNYREEKNHYFHRFRKDAGIIHYSDLVTCSKEHVLRPILNTLLNNVLSDEQLSEVLTDTHRPSRWGGLSSLSCDQVFQIMSCYDALQVCSQRYLNKLLEQKQLVYYKTFNDFYIMHKSKGAVDDALQACLDQGALVQLFVSVYEQSMSCSGLSVAREEVELLRGLLAGEFLNSRFAQSWQLLEQDLSGREVITRIDRDYLMSINVTVPGICRIQGGFQMLDHHRIWAANDLRIPIEVNIYNIRTFN